MPVPGFLSSIADKAQSAINSSSLAHHLPSHGRPTSPDGAAQPSANQAAGGGSHSKSHALEAIQHQLRTFGQQYNSSTTPVQRIITASKGVAIDFDSVSRDAKAQSKEFYTWGQSEDADLKDVTDRLAYLNFVQGSLTSSLAEKLDAARAPLKTLRDAENALIPRRQARASLQNQLARIEHDNQKGMEKKIAELKEQIRKAEADDLPQEREIELLKRKAIRESEELKWQAIREYGEKLVLLSQASTPIIGALPFYPPTAEHPYTDEQRKIVGAARASLQRALDNYKTGHISLPQPASDLSRSDTISFGESHASELSSMHSDLTQSTQPGIPLTPPVVNSQASAQSSTVQQSSPPVKSASPPINPSNLNLSPAPIPNVASSGTPPVPIVAPSPEKVNTTVLPSITPTIAETGVPVSAGADGPGPASGSLRDIKAASPTAGPRSDGFPATWNSQGKWETAEEEKQRLAGYSQALNGPNAPEPAKHETAEEEKKRLEREERERVLAQGTSDSNNPEGKKGGDDELPPYQDV